MKTFNFFAVTTFLLFLCFGFSNAQDVPDRVKGSPYPASSIIDTLYVVNDHHFSEAERLTIQTLQGLLAKQKPAIYRNRGGGYAIWLDQLIAEHGIIADYSFNEDFDGLMHHFKNAISGYIICRLHDASSNAAISACGFLNAVAVTPDQTSVLDNIGIPFLEDFTEAGEDSILSVYDSLLSKDIIVYQKEEKDNFLGDYSVFANAFHFFNPISGNMTRDALNRMDDNAVLLGWGDSEHATVSIASSYSIHVHPADWAVNLSTLSNINAPLQQKTHTEDTDSADDVHTVCFVMTDGDNVQWVLNDFATSDKWFGSQRRGEIHLGWTISPALCELTPSVMRYLYEQAANEPDGKDYFIAGPSGLGYIYPDKFPALDSAAVLLNRFMAKSDLNIVNIIGNNSSDTYLGPYLKQEHIDAVFYYPYSNYSGLAGKIKWINDKPVIGGRYNLWSGFNTPTTLASKLNALPKSTSSVNGYSLIPVHVWSNGVDDILVCADLLDSNVVIVTPEVFVQRIQENLGLTNVADDKTTIIRESELHQNYPNPFNPSTRISYTVARASPIRIQVYTITGQLVKVLVNKNQLPGYYETQWNGRNDQGQKMPSGLYWYSMYDGRHTRTKKFVLIR